MEVSLIFSRTKQPTGIQVQRNNFTHVVGYFPASLFINNISGKYLNIFKFVRFNPFILSLKYTYLSFAVIFQNVTHFLHKMLYTTSPCLSFLTIRLVNVVEVKTNTSVIWNVCHMETLVILITICKKKVFIHLYCN